MHVITLFFLSPIKIELHKGRNYCLFCLLAYISDLEYCLIGMNHSLDLYLVT